MRRFEEMNPWTILLWFIAAAAPVMFIRNPLFVLLSLILAIILRHALYGERILKDLSFSAVMVVFIGLINMLFSHNGVTAVLIVNNNRLTLEALFYGMATGGMLAAVFLWFGLISRLSSTDRILYLTGKVSPKLALTISMTMRYVSLIRKRSAEVRMALRASGDYGDGNGFDRIKVSLKVFSCMTGWILENGIITADSMAARGYMTGKRNSFSLYRMTGRDAAYMAFTSISAVLFVAFYRLLRLDFVYYPALTKCPEMLKAWPVLLIYCLYTIIPALGRNTCGKEGEHERISD